MVLVRWCTQCTPSPVWFLGISLPPRSAAAPASPAAFLTTTSASMSPPRWSSHLSTASALSSAWLLHLWAPGYLWTRLFRLFLLRLLPSVICLFPQPARHTLDSMAHNLNRPLPRVCFILSHVPWCLILPRKCCTWVSLCPHTSCWALLWHQTGSSAGRGWPCPCVPPWPFQPCTAFLKTVLSPPPLSLSWTPYVLLHRENSSYEMWPFEKSDPCLPPTNCLNLPSSSLCEYERSWPSAGGGLSLGPCTWLQVFLALQILPPALFPPSSLHLSLLSCSIVPVYKWDSFKGAKTHLNVCLASSLTNLFPLWPWLFFEDSEWRFWIWTCVSWHPFWVHLNSSSNFPRCKIWAFSTSLHLFRLVFFF